ncbi:MAG: PRC-barrel domain-containing protein [Candidatus Nanoarchaeia archaeon]|nr:PRC-barrel domain-containing protein [Candidatus Nanoarchaeia archaeon]
MDKVFSKEILGKIILSKTGKKFGEVGDLIFEEKSGELISIVVDSPTPNCDKLSLDKDAKGRLLLTFSSVIAVGDYVVVSEEDLL